MKIFSAAINQHDHNTYDGVWHNQVERHTRIKKNMWQGCYDNFFYDIAWPEVNNNDVWGFTYTAGGYWNKDWKRIPWENELKEILKDYDNYTSSWKNLYDYLLLDNIYFIDHHQSHAIYAFLSSGYKESDILAIDGGGNSKHTAFFDKNGKVHDLTYEIPLGWLWGITTRIIGLGGGESSGKTMGLSSYGNFNQEFYDFLELCIEECRRRREMFWDSKILETMEKHYIADCAYTMQQFTIDKIKEVMLQYKSCDNICIAGGVAYNGYMNEMLTKFYKNVFVPPAVGDEGQSLGTYMHAELMLNQNIHIPKLDSGKQYDIEDNEIDYDRIAQMIADGKIIGWFQGRSESGNRALGNRSILADPRIHNIKDIINKTIKKREDWRPFAPSVLEEYYKDYFDTSYPSPYMSRIVKVISDKIPGVTHLDKTARIQTVTKQQNEKFYNLISAFNNITGIPMVLNTSFNCQEPIVETPEHALSTFLNTELDAVVIGSKVIEK